MLYWTLIYALIGAVLGVVVSGRTVNELDAWDSIIYILLFLLFWPYFLFKMLKGWLKRAW